MEKSLCKLGSVCLNACNLLSEGFERLYCIQGCDCSGRAFIPSHISKERCINFNPGLKESTSQPHLRCYSVSLTWGSFARTAISLSAAAVSKRFASAAYPFHNAPRSPPLPLAFVISSKIALREGDQLIFSRLAALKIQAANAGMRLLKEAGRRRAANSQQSNANEAARSRRGARQ